MGVNAVKKKGGRGQVSRQNSRYVGATVNELPSVLYNKTGQPEDREGNVGRDRVAKYSVAYRARKRQDAKRERAECDAIKRRIMRSRDGHERKSDAMNLWDN